MAIVVHKHRIVAYMCKTLGKILNLKMYLSQRDIIKIY